MDRSPRLGSSLVFAMLAATACSSTSGGSAAPGSGGASSLGGAGGSMAAPAAIGACTYVNPFSKGDECKLYTGAAWTAESAADDCAKSLGGAGTWAPGGVCTFAAELGTCTVEHDDGTGYRLISGGADPGPCSAASGACKAFAKGTFAPGATCSGTTTGSGGGSTSSGNVFVQPYRVCKAPLAGEPAGKGDGGNVCTWTLISGCTEEGRHYQDYASCDDVRTNRPYYPASPAKTTTPGDPRLSDGAFMGELAWVRSQVEAWGCICCHSKGLAPSGPSQWFVEADGIWTDSITDSGVAMMANLADSTALGAYPAKDNNGFDRTTLGLPTTDIPRMKAFLLAEWTRRGHVPADGAKYPPFGGPLVDQLKYVPTACTGGEGVSASGAVSWSGGAARYVYVLEASAKSPGVPPNLDVPDGTRWLVQVATKSPAIASQSITYGGTAGGVTQRIPAAGAPAALVSGATYYLIALQDIGIPLTRCLFKMP
jgi:hypothetical protein